MQKVFTYICFILLFSAHYGCAQSRKTDTTNQNTVRGDEGSFLYSAFIPGNYNLLEVDVLDNLYLLTSGFQLKKYNADGDSIAVFNDVKRFGNPSNIDVSNPFKILVYYKNFSTAVILDRQLTARNTINFRKQNIFTARTITTSYDNNIWLFDEQDYKLKKIDDEGRVLLESNDLRIITDNVPSPVQMIDSENFVYVYDPEKGFYVFDYYGALKHNLPFLNWQSISASKNKLMGFNSDTLFTYDLNSLTLKNYSLPLVFKSKQSIKAMNGKVYMLNKEGVTIYTLK